MRKTKKIDRFIRLLHMCRNEWTLLYENEVEITGIHSNMQGEDVLEFICPICGVEDSSRRMLQ